MLAFPSMIAEAAKRAGMKVPGRPDSDNYDRNEYIHWFVYCEMQLGVPITWGNHWRNAKILASIPADDLKKMTASDIFDTGFDP